MKFNQGIVKVEELWEHQDRCKRAEGMLARLEKEMTKVVMGEGREERQVKE